MGAAVSGNTHFPKSFNFSEKYCFVNKTSHRADEPLVYRESDIRDRVQHSAHIQAVIGDI